MTPSPDASAMARLATGDDEALNEIMDRWQAPLATFIWHMTHEEDAARDLTHETFVRLYLHRHRYREKAPFASYLFRIARNLIYNHHRWKRRHPVESLHELASQGFDPEGNGTRPDVSLMEQETANEVRREIAKLPVDLRAALVLFTYQDLGYRDIAAILECTEKAAETRIYRARQMLKERLAPLAERREPRQGPEKAKR